MIFSTPAQFIVWSDHLWGPKKKARTGDEEKGWWSSYLRGVFWRSQGALSGQGKQLIKIICQNKLAAKAEMSERG